jgi:uncharacterized membrane-anchored protein YitT (DUF2179 family)
MKYLAVNKMDNVKEFISDKNNIKRFTYMSIALFVSALCFNLFISPINLVSGGTSGLSIVIRELFGIEASISIFVLSIICFLLSYFYLDAINSIAALFAGIIYPLFIKATSSIGNLIYIDNSDILLLVLFAGIIGGVCQGVVYRQGLNTGGFNVIARIIFKYFHISITKVNFIINFFIVGMGVYLFGFNMLLYAFVYLFISKYVGEKIMLGVSLNKAIYVISDKYKEIVLVLNKDLGHDATIYNVKGKFNDEKRKMVMSVVPNSSYYDAKEMISLIDPDAFIFVCDSYEVYRQDVSIEDLKCK